MLANSKQNVPCSEQNIPFRNAYANKFLIEHHYLSASLQITISRKTLIHGVVIDIRMVFALNCFHQFQVVLHQLGCPFLNRTFVVATLSRLLYPLCGLSAYGQTEKFMKVFFK
jgi:hypothetical protein